MLGQQFSTMNISEVVLKLENLVVIWVVSLTNHVTLANYLITPNLRGIWTKIIWHDPFSSLVNLVSSLLCFFNKKEKQEEKIHEKSIILKINRNITAHVV
jgi:hypothetical protein